MTRHLSRRDTLRASAGLACASLAGCLASTPFVDDEAGEPDDAGELGVPTEQFEVTATSRPFPEFDPQIVHLEPGGRVEWLVETGRHDVTAYHRDGHPPHRTPDSAGPWGSEMLTGPGATYEHAFEQAGVYDYVDTQQVCVSHEIAGNVGRIVVGWPDPDDEPAVAPPPGDLPQRVRNALALLNDRTLPVLEAGP